MDEINRIRYTNHFANGNFKLKNYENREMQRLSDWRGDGRGGEGDLEERMIQTKAMMHFECT